MGIFGKPKDNDSENYRPDLADIIVQFVDNSSKTHKYNRDEYVDIEDGSPVEWKNGCVVIVEYGDQDHNNSIAYSEKIVASITVMGGGGININE